MPELTAAQKNDLLASFDADLAEMVQNRVDKPSLGFVSLCKKLDIPTEAYRESRASDPEFRKACESLELDRQEILGELVYGGTMTAGKPKDKLALAERVSSEEFGKKAEEKVVRVEAFFRQLPNEQLMEFTKFTDESISHILESEAIYGSGNVGRLLSE